MVVRIFTMQPVFKFSSNSGKLQCWMIVVGKKNRTGVLLKLTGKCLCALRSET